MTRSLLRSEVLTGWEKVREAKAKAAWQPCFGASFQSTSKSLKLSCPFHFPICSSQTRAGPPSMLLPWLVSMALKRTALALESVGKAAFPRKVSLLGPCQPQPECDDGYGDDVQILYENLPKVPRIQPAIAGEGGRQSSEPFLPTGNEDEYRLDVVFYLLDLETRLSSGRPHDGPHHRLARPWTPPAASRGARFRQRSPQLRWRAKLVAWLSESAAKLGLYAGCVHQAAALMDGFMDNHFIDGGKLKFVASVALRLAAKADEKESRVPKLSSLTALIGAKYMKWEFKQTEIMFLEIFQWQIGIPTVYSFVELVRKKPIASQQ